MDKNPITWYRCHDTPWTRRTFIISGRGNCCGGLFRTSGRCRRCRRGDVSSNAGAGTSDSS